jgi:hypothetical protein
MNAAEPFSLPNHLEMAEAGLMAHAEADRGVVLPRIPVTLPENSLV